MLFEFVTAALPEMQLFRWLFDISSSGHALSRRNGDEASCHGQASLSIAASIAYYPR